MKGIIVFLVFNVLAFSLFAQVENPDKPLRGNWDFQIKKIWEVESVGSDVLADIQNIKTSRDGRVFVAESKHCLIYIFDKDGKYISSFGKKGEGPGEIMNYSSGEQLFVIDDTVIFVSLGKIQYFSPDGEYKKTVIIPPALKPRTFLSQDVFVSAPSSLVAINSDSAKMVMYNVKDRSSKVITEFKPFKNAVQQINSEGAERRVGVVIPSVTPLMCVDSGGDKVCYGMSNSYNIHFFDSNTNEAGFFGMKGREQIPLSQEFKKEVASWFKDLPPDVVKNTVNGLPDKASFFWDLKVEKNGLVYAFISNPNDSSAQAMDIFSPTGKFLYSSTLKPEEGMTFGVFYFDGDLLYFSVEDKEGTVRVVKNSIKMPVF